MKMAMFYLKSPDLNHLVLAHNQEQAFRMFMDGDGLGLAHIFKGNCELKDDQHGPHLKLYTPNGTKKVYYKGAGNVSASGAIRGMSFGSVTFLEFDLLHPEVIDEAFRRTIAAKWRFHLAEQNPPSPNHPSLEKLERFKKAGTYLFRHWTPNDNPVLTESRKAELEAELKQSDYLYKRDWLGLRVMPEGVIYSQFDAQTHTATQIKGQVIETFFTADGGQGDATSCAFWAVALEKGVYRLYRMANYFHSGKETGVTKAMSIYAKEIKDFIEWCYGSWPDMPRWNYFFVDPACRSLREELLLVGIHTEKADNNSKDKIHSNGTKIEIGIERMQNLLSKGAFLLFGNGDSGFGHYDFIKEIGMYVRNPKTGLPVDKYNHSLDEARYASNYFTRRYIL